MASTGFVPLGPGSAIPRRNKAHNKGVAVASADSAQPQPCTSNVSETTLSRVPKDPTVQISKAMSYVLRHGAEKDGVPIRADGYILISDLVKHKRLRNVTFETIQEIVEGNDKQRFTLLQEGNIWAIRANQGHSIDVKVDMTPITKPSEQPIVIHGTSTKAWETIAKEGLRPMSRQHIHFAPGRPTDQGVISGMRTTCTVYIYIDMVKALAAGIPFSRSSNNVILSPGNKDGIIPREFFRKVEDRDGNIIG